MCVVETDEPRHSRNTRFTHGYVRKCRDIYTEVAGRVLSMSSLVFFPNRISVKVPRIEKEKKTVWGNTAKDAQRGQIFEKKKTVTLQRVAVFSERVRSDRVDATRMRSATINRITQLSRETVLLSVYVLPGPRCRLANLLILWPAVITRAADNKA